MQHFKNWYKRAELALQSGILLPLVVIAAFVAIVYQPFFLKGLLPIPSDTIVGLYHPWRDFYANEYPNGMPYKNFLITDAVRQLYPWRKLAITELKKGQTPLWNPYSFSGMPLAANLQAATFYPLNVLYWLLHFPIAWSVQVVLQTLLGALFMMLFLRRLRLAPPAVALGAIAWSGSGFFLAWLMSNTLVHVAIWLPLMFLGVDLSSARSKKMWIAPVLIALAVACSFLAGALQIFGYCLLAMGGYSCYVALSTRSVKPLLATAVGVVGGMLLAFPQWHVLIGFSSQVIRSVGTAAWEAPGWFIPPIQLAQFLAPDYFGNPATLNYLGVWNYMEFIGYIGIIPLMMAIVAVVFAHKRSLFWVVLVLLSLIMATQNPWAAVPFQLSLPFLSLAQPTRLLVIVDFALAVLAAIGLHTFLITDKKQKKILLTVIIFAVLFAGLWAYALTYELGISINNLIFPTLLFGAGSGLVLLHSKRTATLVILGLLVMTLFDLSRFMGKFEPFTPQAFLFSQTKMTQLLSEKAKEAPLRIATLDDRLMPANFSGAYGISSAAGYDSFFLKRYATFIAAIDQNNARPSITSFTRTLNPKNTTHKLFPLLATNYVLSYGPMGTAVAELTEGSTYLYSFPKAQPRVYFVTIMQPVSTFEALPVMFSEQFNVATTAVVENYSGATTFTGNNTAEITSYYPNEVAVNVQAPDDGYLVFLDAYYPEWQATVDGKPATIYPTNLAFRGVKVPAGSKTVRFFIN